ncbi:hypothetical protein ACHHYP_10742 [Achlya hypogyna]|uniref:Uncharacterized protein n=1 Tax=Achlya hypogyna TaxID=1202772 RepID=A0A1V9ZHZ4_ACHHY|nr:hypothetical protein ACHHYP_10742 [Achlya hypogyna]
MAPRPSVFRQSTASPSKTSENVVWDAVYAQDYPLVQSLLSQEIHALTINMPHGIWGNTCAHIAVLHNNRKMLSLLILHKVNLNAININGTTPLHLAVERRRLDMVKYLVDNGACTSKRNYTFKSPLELAKTLPDAKDMVKILQDCYNIERGTANLS